MRAFILLFLAILATFGRSVGQQPGVLFTVAGSPVTAGEFEYLFRKNHQNRPEEFSPKGIEEYLRLYINFKLKVHEARARGMDTTAAFRKEFDGYRREVRKSYGVQRDDTDALVREAWNRMQTEVRASHLLILGGEELMPEDTLRIWNKLIDLRTRAMNGEDFDELAKKYSEDPSAAKEGPDLGYFSALDMVYPFEHAAFTTAPGNISMPVRTRFGYHLVKVKEVRPVGGEIVVSHIAIRAEEGKEQQAKDRIFEVEEQLRAGRDWFALCKEFSDDEGSKAEGGKLRSFRRGTFEKTAPAFEEAAFSLKAPGDISDPVQTTFGWHILKLEQVLPPPAFETMKTELTRRVSRNERVQLSRNRQLEILRKNFQFREFPEVRKELTSVADTMLQYGKWIYRGSKELAGKTLFNLNNKSYTVDQFIHFAESNQTPGTAEPAILMRRLTDNFINEMVISEEDRRLERENPSYQLLLQEYREGIMLFNIMDQEVWSKASADTVGQRRYYDGHIRQYAAGERIHARVFSTTDSMVVNGIMEKIERGDT
ncbi:MAG: peptidylprolyl isomerase, partial [Bacteroidota bacterium]